MRGFVTTILIALSVAQAMSQQPLNKRDQQRKAEFEAQIQAEENYDKTIKLADKAFRDKNYPEARRLYNEASSYDQNKAQWLQSKVNDLDILMARNISRKVDSMAAMSARPVVSVPIKPIRKDTLARRNDMVVVQPAVAPKEETTPIAAKPETPPAPTKTVVAPKESVPAEPAPKAESISSPNAEVVYKDYPIGLTEEEFDFPNHHVKRIVVKDGTNTIVYKHVTHQWGGKFYFRDDVSVTERTWTGEIEEYRAKLTDKQQ